MFNIEKYNEIKSFLKKTTDIIAISKNHPIDSVEKAINLGVRIFGENRVNEAKSKFLDIKNKSPDIELHLTGPLQSNKVKDAVKLFDVFHTLDREKIANEFKKYDFELKNKKIFVQVNTGNEETKSGISLHNIDEFVKYCRHDLNLNIVGLMCIPPIIDPPREHFEILKNLADKNNLSELSIGMSNDYMDALKFNPRYLRLGTILFGKRK